jgi:hypothetical protein
MQAAAIPMIISALGTAATIKGAADQRKDQRSILNRQMERQEATSKDSAEQVLQEGQRYTQDARQQALADAENQTFEQTQADIQGAGGADISTAADAGAQSDDFLKTKAARAIDEGTRLTSIAREAAKSRAPGQLRMDDSLSMAKMAGNLGHMWGGTKNLAGANSLDAQNVQEPVYGGLGKIATAMGGAMSSGGYGQAQGALANPYNRGGFAGINFGAR